MHSPKTVFVTFLFFLFYCTSIAQVKLVRNIHSDPIQNGWENWFTYHWKELPANGKFIIYYDSTFIHKGYTGEFLNGKRQGTWTSYYLNGRKSRIESYQSDMLVGKAIYFSFRGDTNCVISYLAGKQQGRIVVKEDKPYSTGRYVASISNVKADISSGWQYEFDWNGDTLSKSFYNKEGSATRTVHYYMGRVQSETNYTAEKGFQTTYKKYEELNQIYEVSLGFYTRGDIYSISKMKLDSLALFTNLRSLKISIGKNSDEIPEIIQKLEVLKNLVHLEKIMLVGPFTEIPPGILACKHITELSLRTTLITEIPASISGLSTIRMIYLEENSKMDYSASLKNMSALTNLRQLFMPLDFGKALPENITLLKGLYYLSLGGYAVDRKKDSTQAIDVNLIYQLKELRNFELSAKQFWRIDQFEFVKQLPNCKMYCYESCFSSGTQITLADGSSKAIEKIRNGDVVLAYNETSGKMDTATVNWVYTHQEPMEGIVTINCFSPGNDSNKFTCLHTTAIHPFYSSGKWVKAAELKKGDKVLYYHADGTTSEIVIEGIDFTQGNNHLVYNLRTSKHTFIVNGIVVHNK